MKRYSIILPVRNGGEYLKLCIKSILSQTLTAFDFVILDNNSSDGSIEWVRSLKDERISIYSSSKTLSIEENWARICDVPKNEFITLIGHDDSIEPFFLEEIDRLINKHPKASLYQTHYEYIDSIGKHKRHCLPMDEIQTSFEFLACQMNNTIDSMGTGYVMRSKDYDDIGGISPRYPNLIFADYELWIKLASKSYKATSLRKCFQYREHLSVSGITNGELYLKAFEIYIQFIAELNKLEYFSTVIRRYGNKWLLYFCESLSHRLLKTSLKNRKIKVDDLILRFKDMALLIDKDMDFDPMGIKRVRLAASLDRNAISRRLFYIYKAFINQKNVRY